MRKNPIHRKYHQNEITFRTIYQFHDNFVMPLSRDEVVAASKAISVKAGCADANAVVLGGGCMAESTGSSRYLMRSFPSSDAGDANSEGTLLSGSNVNSARSWSCTFNNSGNHTAYAICARLAN